MRGATGDDEKKRRRIRELRKGRTEKGREGKESTHEIRGESHDIAIITLKIDNDDPDSKDVITPRLRIHMYFVVYVYCICNYEKDDGVARLRPCTSLNFNPATSCDTPRFKRMIRSIALVIFRARTWPCNTRD